MWKMHVISYDVHAHVNYKLHWHNNIYIICSKSIGFKVHTGLQRSWSVINTALEGKLKLIQISG